jgi:hypothetical protein
MSIFKKLFGKPTKESSPVIEPENEHKLDESPGEKIITFQHSIKHSIEWNDLNDVEFAMWLPCDQDKLFASSPFTDKWTVAYSFTKYNWSYIAADLLKTLNLADEETFRIGLPDTFQAFAFLTTDDEQIILSLSEEKGIRLHFAETTSLNYRLLFMDHFVSYCKAWNDLIELNDGEKDDDLGFEKWWSLTLKTSISVEENEPLTGVGKIVK